MSPEGAPALLVLILGAGQTAAALVQGVVAGGTADRGAAGGATAVTGQSRAHSQANTTSLSHS